MFSWFKRKIKYSHWWREQGDGSFVVRVTITYPRGSTVNKYVGTFCLSNEMPLNVQTAAMERICKGLDKSA